jgi:NADH:ubiquinone oxidoreductase subunit 3 (subunit A)
MFAPAIAGFLSMGVIFVNFGNMMRDEIIMRLFPDSCSILDPGACVIATMIVAITVGLVAFYYVWTVIEYWRGKDY